MNWPRVARRIRVPMGFAFAAFYVWLARPSAGSIAGSLVLVVPGLWLRAYASGYVKKNAELTVTGPYAYTRNPLYLGSLLLAVGFAAASRSWCILGALAGIFALIYVPTIRSEEEYLRAHFASFDAYARRVPRLIPRIFLPGSQADTGERGSFTPALYRKHREYNSCIGAALIYATLVVRLYFAR